MKAQALLPVNALITQIDIGYYDADPDNRILFYFGTHNILGSAYTNLGTVATETSDGFGYVSITGLSYVVPSTREIQVMVVSQTNAGTSIKWPGSSLMVKGARIHYQISSAF